MTLHKIKGCFTALTSVAAALAFASCTKEAPSRDPVPGDDYTLEECVFQAVGDTAATKTQLSGTSVLWQSSDQLAVFASAPSAVSTAQCFTTTGSGATASFSGQIKSGTTAFTALYPYSDGLSFDGTSISGASIPTEQAATGNSFASGASLAIADGTRVPGGDCSAMTFSNLCAVISFALPEDMGFVNKITISSKENVPMTGGVTINTSDKKLSGANTASVVLSGTFEGGKTYYAAIAPGTYTNGFKFEISTSAGKTYERETSKEVNASAGEIYPLGTLTLVLSSSDIKSAATDISFENTFSSEELSGTNTNCSCSVTFNDEIKSLVKSYRCKVTLSKGGVTYRSIDNANATAATMTAPSNLPYLPTGDYTYTAELYYSINTIDKTTKQSKTVERGPITLSGGTVSKAAPTGLTIQANLTGYTSYSVYKGTDGQTASASNANGCDNATIYNIGATYASGVSSAVLTQLGTSVTIKSTLDNSEKSGDQGSQSWASHAIGANWSFDGGSGTCANTKTVHVTGLPFAKNQNLVAMQNSWTTSGQTSWQSDCLKCWGQGVNGGDGTATVCVIPTGGSANITIAYKMVLYSRTSQPAQGRIYFDGAEVASKDYQKSHPWNWNNTTEESTNTTYTASAGSHTGKVYANSSWSGTEGTAYVNFYYYRVTYR